MQFNQPAHRQPLSSFKERASITRLHNHGRVAEIVYDGRSLGFVDHDGCNGLEQAYRREINNALHQNEEGNVAMIAVLPPSVEAVEQYPDLQDRFPGAYQWVLSNPDVGFEMMSLALLSSMEVHITGSQAAFQLVQLGSDDSTDLMNVRLEGQTYRLQLKGSGPNARFVWYWIEGHTSLGQPMSSIPLGVIPVVKQLQVELAHPTEHPSGGDDLRMLSPIGLSVASMPALY